MSRRLPDPSKPWGAKSPSERKNDELYFNAQSMVGIRPAKGGIYLHHSRCASCAHWPLCLPELGKGQANMNYCARPTRGYKHAGRAAQTKNAGAE